MLDGQTPNGWMLKETSNLSLMLETAHVSHVVVVEAHGLTFCQI